MSVRFDSSFKKLRPGEQEQIEKAIWTRYNKLGEDKVYGEQWGQNVENIRHYLKLMREAMRKLGMIK